MKNTVYEAFTRRAVFEGSAQECWKLILDQVYKMADGRVLYRMWTEDGDRFIDVGKVFIFNE